MDVSVYDEILELRERKRKSKSEMDDFLQRFASFHVIYRQSLAVSEAKYVANNDFFFLILLAHLPSYGRNHADLRFSVISSAAKFKPGLNIVFLNLTLKFGPSNSHSNDIGFYKLGIRF